MSKPQCLTLNSKEKKSVLSIFNGRSRTVEQTADARKIADTIGVSRHQVMLFLEKEGLRSYSESSYC